jgi:DNA polymerase III sliding clamp (beta) subunit (PCNA family)
VAADFKGEESAIAFSPQYLLDGLAGALTAAVGAASAGPAAAAPQAQAQAQDGTAAAKEGRIRLQFTSPTKPALITGSVQADDKAAPDYRYLVVPLRALAG